MASAEGGGSLPFGTLAISGGFSAGFARVLAVGHGQDAGEGCRRERMETARHGTLGHAARFFPSAEARAVVYA